MNVAEINPKSNGTVFPFVGMTAALIAVSVWVINMAHAKNYIIRAQRTWSRVSPFTIVQLARGRRRSHVIV